MSIYVLELDESEHGVDPALVVVELEDAVGNDGVDVAAKNFEILVRL